MRLIPSLILTLAFLCLKPTYFFGQEFKYRGFSYYTEYDDSFTSPESRHKKGVSLGFKSGVFTNRTTTYDYTETLSSVINSGQDSIVNRTTKYVPWHGGISIGFHYMFLKRRKLTLYKKDKYKRTEFNAFNIVFTPFFAFADTSDFFSFNPENTTINNRRLINSHNVLKITYTTPFLSYRGKLFNFYFLNEFGFNFSHRNKVLYPTEFDKRLKTFFTIDPLKIKLGKGKIFFSSTVNIAFDNAPLQPNKIEANFNAGLLFYMFKNK